MLDELETRKEGAAAYLKGYSTDSNPYQESMNRSFWAHGYLDEQHKEHTYRQPEIAAQRHKEAMVMLNKIWDYVYEGPKAQYDPMHEWSRNTLVPRKPRRST